MISCRLILRQRIGGRQRQSRSHGHRPRWWSLAKASPNSRPDGRKVRQRRSGRSSARSESLSRSALFALFQPAGTPLALPWIGAGPSPLRAAASRGMISTGPVESVVLQLTGDHLENTIRSGLGWGNRVPHRTRVSARSRYHEPGMLEVGDAEGSLVEISAAGVCRVRNTARAPPAVEDHPELLRLPAELSVRQVASGYACDPCGRDFPSPRGNSTEIHQERTTEISGRETVAWATVLAAGMTHRA